MRVILLVIFMVAAYSSSHAESGAVPIHDFDYISKRLSQTMYDEYYNFKEIQEVSSNFTYEERAKLFMINRISYDRVATETLLNLFPSLGSWLLGNYFSAIAIDTGLLIGGGFLTAGILLNDNYLAAASVYGMIEWWALSMFFPAAYASKHNQRLEKALGLTPLDQTNMIFVKSHPQDQPGISINLPVFSVAF